MKLSVIIPSRNEQRTLERTLRNLQENIKGDTDVHVILDRWTPDPEIHMNDDRFFFHSFPGGIGQREGMNYVTRLVDSDLLFKLDAHCAVSPGFDVELVKTFKELGGSPTVVPLMYNLDVETFKPKKHKRTAQMYMAVEKGDLRALYYRSFNKPEEPKDIYVDTMACMGPGWCVKRDWFIKTGMCDTNGVGQAGWGAQSVEVSCKAWLSGERLVTTKRCWFAHWFRGGEGFPYPISGNEVSKVRRYQTDLWLNDKWEHRHPDRTWNWLLEKFNPPGWHEDNTPVNITDISKERQELFATHYKKLQREKFFPIWKGIPIMKLPSDLTLYSEVIQKHKPEYIVEIGTHKGGSAVFFQDMMDASYNGGKVITIDIENRVRKRNPRITYLLGDSKSQEILNKVKQLVGDSDRVMVIVDGDHSSKQVKWELHRYKTITTKGQYMVAEDCYIDRGAYGPKSAVDWFLNNTSSYEYVDLAEKYLVGVTMGGWLLKTK